MSAAPQEDSDALPSPAARPVRGVRPTSVAARLRAEYAREVATLGYHAHSVPGALAHLALHLGLAVAAAAAFELLLPHAPRAAWLVYPLLAFLIATRFRAVGNMLHEACHGMLVRGKRHNRNLGHLLAVLDLTAWTRIAGTTSVTISTWVTRRRTWTSSRAAASASRTRTSPS